MGTSLSVEGKVFLWVDSDEEPKEFMDRWVEFIKSQGIEVDKDGHYDGYFWDFMGALTILEDMTMYKAEQCGNDIFDLSYIPEDMKEEDMSLLDEILEIHEYGIMFMPYQFYRACEGKLAWEYSVPMKKTPGHRCNFHVRRVGPQSGIHVVSE